MCHAWLQTLSHWAVYLLFGSVQEHRTAINLPIVLNQGGVRDTSSFPHMEAEETAEELTEKTLAKEPWGVFCAVKGSNLRNDELGHASTYFPISCNFNLVQDWTLGTPKYEACKINFPFHPFPISKVWFWGFMILWTCIGSVPGL